MCKRPPIRERHARAQTPPSYEEKDLATLECFLESAVSIFEQANVTFYDIALFHWLVSNAHMM